MNEANVRVIVDEGSRQITIPIFMGACSSCIFGAIEALILDIMLGINYFK
ncbi:hypothetical protein DSUL_30120 [Desulfovibrionales bacterium]